MSPTPTNAGDPGGANTARVLASRLANKREIILTTIFLLVLTVSLLGGITWKWPWCSLPDLAATPTPTPTLANTNNAVGTNANTNAGANTNTNANTNANTNVNTNTNTNVNTNTNTATPREQQDQPVLNQQSTGAPVITSVEPGSGSIKGNTVVTVKGTGLAKGDVIRFDRVEAPAGDSDISATSMTVRTKPHEAGVVDVTVERAGKVTSTLANQYRYVCPAPEGTELFLMLIMAGALGGCIHALRSLYWYVGNEELRLPWLLMYYILPFSGAAMAMIFSLLIFAGFINNTTSQNTSLFMIALAGLVGMFSQQAALKLTDIANATFTKPGPGKDSKPQESQSVGAGGGPAALDAHITPNFGPPGGGTSVVITNTGFTDARSVTFGGVAATGVTFDKTSSNITAVTPAHAPGEVEVVVTNAASKTVKLRYTYTLAVGGGGAGAGAVASPKIDPAAGPAAGGTPVTITGTGFTDVAQVLFDTGPSATTPAVSADKNSITATAPPHAVGVVTVTVKNQAGAVKTLKYEYK